MPPGEFIYTLNGPDTKSRGLPPKILGQGELSTSTLCDLMGVGLPRSSRGGGDCCPKTTDNSAA